ncbi:argininosuccinate lyase [Pseudothermotoga thermarum]|uniref:Argininosuccinate lyase n=1 Tax=Pseudothermotoga thermarum DSM 5069 TaxID=688269 RepID=F7YU11_9THEM|nr:argininosuccinate lyase [Pseudothermotoga thermarum]AEH51593.1 argininosuccinate lyase [Pseudothermotoga thermarum DSM 5069]
MSEKLWDKGYQLDSLIEDFTVGEDYLLDMKLIEYDILASIAHARMLQKKNLLTVEEFSAIENALKKLLNLVEAGKFEIKKEQEDCHTAIENFLVQEIGEIGKKIHTARSRNDQVLTAIRLYQKDELMQIYSLIKDLQKSLKKFAKKYRSVQFAGYTHTRKAMPTNFEIYAYAFVDALQDDLKLLKAIYEIIDQCPLGTGAGYGVPIEVDREFTAKELGFKKVQENPIYAQNSRAKFDALIVQTLLQIGYDLNKLATDLIFFSLEEIGYVVLPKQFCTGSSIMPHKFNPDPLELLRANYHRLIGNLMQILSLSSNLISGYHRDFQLLKKPLIDSFETVKQMIVVMKVIVDGLKVDEEKCKKSLTEEVFSTHKVYELVKQGIPFREAYKMVAIQYSKGGQV